MIIIQVHNKHLAKAVLDYAGEMGYGNNIKPYVFENDFPVVCFRINGK